MLNLYLLHSLYLNQALYLPGRLAGVLGEAENVFTLWDRRTAEDRGSGTASHDI